MLFHRHKESVKGENTQNSDVRGELESLTCDNPDGDWNAHDADEDTGIFPFSPIAFHDCADNNLAATAPPHEAEILGMGCYRRPTESDDRARKFTKTQLTTIAEESEPQTRNEGRSAADRVDS